MRHSIKIGIMKQGVQLLGTSLTLKEGEKVELAPATNLPQGGWFARPVKLRGIWKEVNSEVAILLNGSEFEIDGPA